MRCPDCNHFVSFDPAEPEMDVDFADGALTGTVRIVLNCAECGQELKDATLDVEHEITLPEHVCEGTEEVEWTIIQLSVENTDRTEGKGRGTKTFYGYEISGELVCGCGKSKVEVSVSDDIQASAMDELV